jgi:RNase P/RNase MRP subunit p29
MNRYATLTTLLLTLAVAAAGCTEKQRKGIKHIKSDLVGLKRRVLLLDCNGQEIRRWEGRFKIEIQGSFLSFIDDDGKEVKVAGTVIVEEL